MADREEETAAGAEDQEQEHAAAAGEEEDTGAQIAPIVRLEEVVVNTGEENEESLLEMKAKLYRFDQEWKERGVGQVKILKHNETKKVRVLMRQNKTLKICANHYLIPGMTLQEHAGSDKSWVWHAMDFSEGEVKKELLCIRLGSVENAQRFKEVFDDATESQVQRTPQEKKEAADVAESLENLSVKDLSSEPVKGKVEDKDAPADEKKPAATEEPKAEVGKD